jgi:hypothetical protein
MVSSALQESRRDDKVSPDGVVNDEATAHFGKYCSARWFMMQMAGASIDAAQVREMKAQGLGVTKIVKALDSPGERLSAVRGGWRAPAFESMGPAKTTCRKMLLSEP